MERSQTEYILKDLKKKMVFITGPRQVGKTWLAKYISKQFSKKIYLNYDDFDDRNIIQNKTWPKDTELIIFDELHKMPEWKTFIKGIYDNRLHYQKILITGSARLHTFKKSGESLAGRYYLHRLLPFSLSELSCINSLNKNSFRRLISRGGFPEPFLSEDDTEALRWRNLYINGLIREDIMDFTRITEIKKMELLIEMLRRRVGSPVSSNSIAQDLQISPTTTAKYIEIMEALFIIFKVTPFSHNIARSILKEPKIYFYDTGMVIGDDGAKLENFSAVSLLKHIYLQNDIEGKQVFLNYLKTKEGKEIDFCFADNYNIFKIFEIKTSSKKISPALKYFSEKYNLEALQLVKDLQKEQQLNNIHILNMQNFFQSLNL